jgi:hypothetical protein
MDQASTLIGQNINTAEAPKGYHIRVCSIDGEAQRIHDNFSYVRINVYTENDIITKIDGIY